MEKNVNSVKLREYQLYSKSVKIFMLLTGLWPVEKPKIAYRLLPIGAIICNIFVCIVHLRFAAIHISNVSLLTASISLGTSFGSTALKASMLTINKGKISRFLQVLQRNENEFLADENLKHVTLAKVTIFRRLSWCISILCYFGVSGYCISPLILILVQRLHDVQTIHYALPLYAAYPWEIPPGGSVYKITYAFEAYNLATMYFITSAIDSLFAYSIFHIIGQLRCLGYQITHLKCTDNVAKFLRQFVTKFIRLRRCADVLQTIYGPIIFYQLLINSLCICMALYQIFEKKTVPIEKYISLGAYSATKLVQTYLYAYSGTALTSESEALTESIYFSNWDRRKRSYWTSILIMLGQKEIVMIVANFITVSNDLFVKTLNTAVSYFFLLKAVAGKQSQ